MELATLLERCREGNELAWEALVRGYQGRVFGLAVHYLGDPEEARDVAQEIFVRIFRKLDDCTDATRFVPWMLRVARNACIDQIRRRKARPPAHDVPVEDVHDLASSSPAPDEALYDSSRKQLVHRGIQSLGELNREIIVLKDIQGLSLEEIAKMLEIPLGTVKSRCSRARLELARKLATLTGGRYGAENI
jgi:RNA polymerase sigma-70 factor (ECF subfamily)